MKNEELNKLREKCNNCMRCELGKTRINIVFSDGNPNSAKAILIGEAPGENEDKTGTPFVGRAGKLLNEFLEKSGISRTDDLYIINTVKCRPPDNRNPEPEEKEAVLWRTPLYRHPLLHSFYFYKHTDRRWHADPRALEVSECTNTSD